MAISEEIMLKVENVSKVYKLGEIGGTTIRDELQRLGAKIRHKPDPTKKVGAKNYNKGEKFKALDNVSFEVKKGERIGIIGHNGAGKSTLLKLISRVTGPTSGNIYMNGRVASMLEVGTGFHPELTGRENVYMNGAILGMTKKEIDAKMEDIIEFSEVRQFIDTPVKRYSSGMYVKLAFSVAAHLDSEIMIMDEVLAVGDINFQQKCISKMKKVSLEEKRTVLYVSHNMKTIKDLCDRVIVLSHGSIVFDGDVDKGLSIYTKNNEFAKNNVTTFTDKNRVPDLKLGIEIVSVHHIVSNLASLSFYLDFISKFVNVSVVFRLVIFDVFHNPVCTSYTNPYNSLNLGKQQILFSTDISMLVDGMYLVDIIANVIENDSLSRQDVIRNAFSFEKVGMRAPYGIQWLNNSWGNVQNSSTVKGMTKHD